MKLINLNLKQIFSYLKLDLIKTSFLIFFTTLPILSVILSIVTYLLTKMIFIFLIQLVDVQTNQELKIDQIISLLKQIKENLPLRLLATKTISIFFLMTISANLTVMTILIKKLIFLIPILFLILLMFKFGTDQFIYQIANSTLFGNSLLVLMVFLKLKIGLRMIKNQNLVLSLQILMVKFGFSIKTVKLKTILVELKTTSL